MGEDTWGLFRKILRRQYHLGFQCNLMTYVFAIADLAYIPLLLSHTAPPNYIVIL
jgi:hypothetical protein